MRLSDWERKGSHGHISSLGSSQHQQQTKVTFPSPVHQTDRTRERERAPTCHHRQMPLHLQEDGHCFREEGPHKHASHSLLTRIMLKTENLWNWCHQVAQKANGVSVPPAAHSPLLSHSSSVPHSILSSFCPQMVPTNSISPGSCPQRFAKAAVKIGFKITADSTPRFLPAQIRSVNLFCQINERSRLLSCSKSFRLGLPSWHLAGCRQGTGRVGRH